MNGTQKPFVVSETRLYRRWKELKVLHTLKKDDINYITLTIEVDVNKFKFDDAASRKKAPTLYNTVNAALKRKDNMVSYQLSKEAILEYEFKEVK